MKPRKAGRPPRSKRTALARFELRLTDAEYKRWSKAAADAGVTLAAFVRASVEAAIT